MDNIVCYCLKCKSEIGRFRNAWNGIGNTYFSPVHKLISDAGLETTGDIYEAARGSSIQYSFLRDIACAKCKMVLGLRCDSAPKIHILKQGQLILRLKDMSIISQSSGKVAHVSVIKRISLKDEKKINTDARSTSSVQSSSYISTPSFLSRSNRFDDTKEKDVERPVIQELSSHGKSSVTDPTYNIKTLAIHVGKFKNWAEEMISNQQKDINRISGAVFRVENDIQALMGLVQEINGNLASSRRHTMHDKKLVEMRKDIKRVSEKLNHMEESLDWDKNAIPLARNLKSVVGDVKHLNSQAEKIHGLSLSLESLADRVHKLEAQEKSPMSIKHPTRTGKPSDKTLSRKRTRDPSEKQIYNQKQVNLSQLNLKKRCLDESHDAKDLYTDPHNAESDLVDLSSMEPKPQILDPNQTKIPYQSHIIAQKSSYSKPQVLIYGSSSKASVPELKKESKLLYPKAIENTVSGRQPSAEKRIDTTDGY